MTKTYITFEEAARLLTSNPKRQDLELYSMGMTQRVVVISKHKRSKTRYPWKVKTNRFVLLYELTATNIIYQVR